MLQAPESAFADVPDFEYEPRFVETDVAEVAYVDRPYEGDGEPSTTFLCLHGEPTWSFLYRRMMPTLAERGRVVAPDLPGFGRSEKWPAVEDYTFDRLAAALEGFIAGLDLTDVTLVCQDWGGILGLTLAAERPERFDRLVPMNTGLPDGTQEMPDLWWAFHDAMAEREPLHPERTVRQGCATSLDDEVVAAYGAPFPDQDHVAGARALPGLVPTDPDDPGADRVRAAREALADWDKPAFVLFADGDPITRGSRDDLRELLPTASEQPDVWVEGAAHFLQEDAGEAVAERIVAFVDRT